ncbi:MAG: hypothetical protein AAB646_03055, partial [Patescibacteria group bacterium]
MIFPKGKSFFVIGLVLFLGLVFVSSFKKEIVFAENNSETKIVPTFNLEIAHAFGGLASGNFLDNNLFKSSYEEIKPKVLTPLVKSAPRSIAKSPSSKPVSSPKTQFQTRPQPSFFTKLVNNTKLLFNEAKKNFSELSKPLAKLGPESPISQKRDLPTVVAKPVAEKSGEKSKTLALFHEKVISNLNKLAETVGDFLGVGAEPEEPKKPAEEVPTVIAVPADLTPAPAPKRIDKIIQPTAPVQLIREVVRTSNVDNARLDALASQFVALDKSIKESLSSFQQNQAYLSQITNLGPRGNTQLTIGDPNVTGNLKGADANFTGGVSVGGSLSAGGTSVSNLTVSGTLSVSGNDTFNFDGSKLKVGTDSIVIDGIANVISSPSSALSIYTTSTPLALSALTASSTFSSYFLGNLGIGTTTPGAGLSLAATSSILGNSAYLYGQLTAANVVATTTASSGFGTSTPYGFVSIDGPTTADAKTPLFVVQDSGTSTPSIYVDGGYGRVGIGTSSPMAQLAIEVATNKQLLPSGVDYVPAFLIGSRGTSTPLFIVTNDIGANTRGTVGIGTSSPGATLAVGGFGYVKGNWNVEATSTLSSVIATSTLEVRGIDGAATPIFLANSAQRIGVATATPYGLVSIDVPTGPDDQVPAFVIQDSGTSTPSIYVDGGYGRVGIGTSSPQAQFAIELVNGSDPNNKSTAGFVVSSRGTSTPSLYVSNANSRVGVATSAPSALFAVDGQVMANTLGVGIAVNPTSQFPFVVHPTGSQAGAQVFSSEVSNVAMSLRNDLTNGREYWMLSSADGSGAGAGDWAVFDNTAALYRLNLASTGDFGIGTVTPGTKLDVAGFGVVKGNWNVEATSTLSSVIATSTLEVRGIDGAATPIFLANSAQRIGVATATPYGLVSIDVPTGPDDQVPAFVIQDSGTSTPSIYVEGGYGRVGFGTSSPQAQVAIEITGEPGNNANEDVPAFMISARGSSTPALLVRNNTGQVLIGTNNTGGISAPLIVGGNPGLTILAAGNPGISFRETNTSETALTIQTSSGTGFITAGTGAFNVRTSDSVNRWILDTGGDTTIGNASSTIGLKLEVAGFGVVKGNWNVEATSTLSSVIATSTLEVRGIDGAATPIFLANSAQRIGVATATPYGLVSIDVPTGPDDQVPAFVIQDSGTSTPSIYVEGGYGRVGFGTSSPQAQVAIEITGEPGNNANEGIPAFMISSRGTSTPFFTVVRNTSLAAGNGMFVGIGTSSPNGAFSVDTTDVNSAVPAILVRAGATANVAIQVDSGDVCKDGSAEGACALNDLAELFPFDPVQGKPSAGDIVMLDPDKPLHLKKASAASFDSPSEHPSRLAGIISTSPAIVFEGSSTKALGGTYKSDDDKLPLTLSGRVPVKVNLEGGDIKIGDPIALSSIPGIGTKATKSGQIVGYALENYGSEQLSGGKTKVIVLANLTNWTAPAILDASTPTAETIANETLNSSNWLALLFEKIQAWLKDAVLAIKELVVE